MIVRLAMTLETPRLMSIHYKLQVVEPKLSLRHLQGSTDFT